MGVMEAQFWTTHGEKLDMDLAHGATVGDVQRILTAEYGFNVGAQLMHSGNIINPGRRVSEFPFGSLLIVGKRGGAPQRQQPQPARQAAQPAPAGRSPAGRAAPPGRSPVGGPSQMRRTHSPQTSPARTPAARPGQSVPNLWTLEAIVPATNRKIPILIQPDATVADFLTLLVGKDPSLAGARLVHQGKVLSDMASKLEAHHIREGSHIHVATGAFHDKNVLLLFEIRANYERARNEVIDAGGVNAMPEIKRKGLYEDLMRTLFKTDGIDELPEEFRPQRKQLVKDITRLQDELQPGQ